MATTTTTGKATQAKVPLYLLVTEDRSGEYYHLKARVVIQKYEDGEYAPYGPDDQYGDGPLLRSLEATCQGDSRSRLRESDGPVYGYSTEYRNQYSMDLRTLRRMVKTLDRFERGMAKLYEARGSVGSYGDYLGRVAEVLGCVGMGFQVTSRTRASGQRWIWQSVGAGVDKANRLIELWRQEGLPQPAADADADDQAGQAVIQ